MAPCLGRCFCSGQGRLKWAGGSERLCDLNRVTLRLSLSGSETSRSRCGVAFSILPSGLSAAFDGPSHSEGPAGSRRQWPLGSTFSHRRAVGFTCG